MKQFDLMAYNALLRTAGGAKLKSIADFRLYAQKYEVTLPATRTGSAQLRLVGDHRNG